MERTRKLAMVAATFFLAAATGQYMQNSAPPRKARSEVPHVVAQVVPVPRRHAPMLRIEPAVTEAAAATLPEPPALPGLPDALPVALRLPVDAGTAVAVAAAPACDPHLTLAAAPAAMLSLVLEARCNASERVVILSDGLSFTALTSDAGGLRLTLPAMRDPAQVTVRFPGGQRVTAGADVPQLAQVSRVAVQWEGPDAFRLDALEFGAAFGSAGDVSPDAPRVPSAPGRARGGYMKLLGDASVPLPMLAQVYTVPKALSAAGKVALQVSAPVTEKTCGRELLGQMVVAGGDASYIELAMPGCDEGAMGQSVALTGLAPTIAVAAR